MMSHTYTTTNTTTGGGGSGSNSWSRNHERHELQRLNDRLASYIENIKNLQNQGNQIDSSAFVNSVQILEGEMGELKRMYEEELNSLRLKLDEDLKEKNHWKIQANKNQASQQQFQDRFAIEADKYRKAIDEINGLQRLLSQKDGELLELKMAAMAPIDELAQIKRDYEVAIREAENYKRRYDHEQKLRQDLDDQLHQLHKKVEFDSAVRDKAADEMKGRLELSTNTILNLESRLREVSKTDGNIGDKLQQIRKAAEDEILKYRTELEENFNRTVISLKCQIDRDTKSNGDLTNENARLQSIIDDLNGKIAQLEGQISGLKQDNENLNTALMTERNRTSEKIRSLRENLTQLQQQLIINTKQNTGSDTFIPIKHEIEAYKVLLEGEEKRIHCPLGMTEQIGLTSSAGQLGLTSSAGQLGLTSSAGQIGLTSSAGQIGLIGGPSAQLGLGLTGGQSAQLGLGLTGGQSAQLGLGLTGGQSAQLGLGLTGVSGNYVSGIVPIEEPHVQYDSAQNRADMKKISILGGATDKLERTEVQSAPADTPPIGHRPSSSTSHDYTNATSTSVCDVKILEVHPQGKYIRLQNCSNNKDVEFGGYMIQQNVGGNPVAVYRFPPRVKFMCNDTITVWSGNNDPILHEPPTDFVFKEQQKWGTGPECTTILCKPNGQAVAWTTAAHRFTKDAFDLKSSSSQVADDDDDNNETDFEKIENTGEILTEYPQPKIHESVYLRREKMEPPLLTSQKHPHGLDPLADCHPRSGQQRPLVNGNDNSSVNRQTRSQSTRPDPVYGQPYSGASAQRMGSSPLRRYITTDSTIRGSGHLANRAAGEIRYGPPSPHLSPIQQELSRVSGSQQSTLVRFSAA
ncbi:lamin-A-like isoform X2 [Tubulanus polymorphus]|uniref:lamin-A-like isoform X2 n=1 Tax=Tubulanus polymorphus TaxID=672921 RepID=UPI003DA65607